MQIKSSINEHGIPYPWTKGIWSPEPNPPSYVEEVEAYKMAIIAIGISNKPVVVGFAFGETPEMAEANAWVMAASKEVLHNLQSIIRPPGQFPNVEEGKKIYNHSINAIEKAITPFMKKAGIIIAPPTPES